MSTHHDEFLKRIMIIQPSLYAYVRSFGFHADDTDDILQDVAVELWRSYSTYDATRPFVGWALGVAKNLIRMRRRRDRVRSNVVADSRLYERVSDAVASALTAHQGHFAEEKEHLSECLKRLPESAKTMLHWRYAKRLDIGAVSKRIGKSYSATHMALTRIRERVMDCITARKSGATA